MVITGYQLAQVLERIIIINKEEKGHKACFFSPMVVVLLSLDVDDTLSMEPTCTCTGTMPQISLDKNLNFLHAGNL